MGSTVREPDLEDAIPKYVGDFRLQEVKDFPEGIQLGAEEALTATYKRLVALS
jgi:hypothetical protein